MKITGSVSRQWGTKKYNEPTTLMLIFSPTLVRSYPCLYATWQAWSWGDWKCSWGELSASSYHLYTCLRCCSILCGQIASRLTDHEIRTSLHDDLRQEIWSKRLQSWRVAKRQKEKRCTGNVKNTTFPQAYRKVLFILVVWYLITCGICAL